MHHGGLPANQKRCETAFKTGKLVAQSVRTKLSREAAMGRSGKLLPEVQKTRSICSPPLEPAALMTRLLLQPLVALIQPLHGLNPDTAPKTSNWPLCGSTGPECAMILSSVSKSSPDARVKIHDSCPHSPPSFSGPTESTTDKRLETRHAIQEIR